MNLLALLLYQALFPLVAAFPLLRLLLAGRGKSLREDTGQLRQRLGLVDEHAGRLFAQGRPRLWLHAASVGEVTAAAPLIAALSQEAWRPTVLVTTSTAAGREKAASLPGVDLALLAPADFYPCVSRFLRVVRPSSLILVEAEYWPLTLRLACARGVRVGLVNSRLSARSARAYRLLKPLWSLPMSRVLRAAVQGPEDARRLASLGVPQAALKVAGNMKYDSPPVSEASRAEAAGRLARLGWAQDPVWSAGSTRRGEEEVVLRAHQAAKRAEPRLKLVLAPRHPERSEEAALLLGAQRLGFIRLSELDSGADPPREGTDCLLVDRFGALGGLYAWSAAAFVGGTLVPAGGHNLLEPAGLGVPVIFGPHTGNISDPARSLIVSGGGRLAQDSEDIAAHLREWLLDPAARERASASARATWTSYTGATARAFEHLKPMLLPSVGN